MVVKKGNNLKNIDKEIELLKKNIKKIEQDNPKKKKLIEELKKEIVGTVKLV